MRHGGDCEWLSGGKSLCDENVPARIHHKEADVETPTLPSLCGATLVWTWRTTTRQDLATRRFIVAGLRRYSLIRRRLLSCWRSLRPSKREPCRSRPMRFNDLQLLQTVQTTATSEGTKDRGPRRGSTRRGPRDRCCANFSWSFGAAVASRGRPAQWLTSQARPAPAPAWEWGLASASVWRSSRRGLVCH